MLENLTRDDFAKHLNETFRLDLGADFVGLEALELSLIQADPIRLGHSLENRRTAFSLIFRGPLEPVLSQSIYPLDNGAMGRMDLFLVPIGPDDQGQRYEAVFT